MDNRHKTLVFLILVIFLMQCNKLAETSPPSSPSCACTLNAKMQIQAFRWYKDICWCDCNFGFSMQRLLKFRCSEDQLKSTKTHINQAIALGISNQLQNKQVKKKKKCQGNKVFYSKQSKKSQYLKSRGDHSAPIVSKT